MALRKGDLERLWDACSVDLHPSIISSLLKPTGRGGVYAARDYISALSWVAAAKKFNVDFLQCDSFNDFKQGIPAPYRFRLSYYTPCLAYRYDELKPDMQKKIFDSKEYLFTEKCFGKNTTVLMSDFSYKYIKDIQIGDKVMNFKDGHYYPVEVVGLYQSKDKERLYSVKGKGLATADHKWKQLDGSWCETKDLRKVIRPELSKEQLQFLVGTYLGDGNIGNKCFYWGHSIKQEEWLREKIKFIGMASTGIRYYVTKSGHGTCQSMLLTNTLFSEIEKKVGSAKQKAITKYVENLFSPALFASWYLDDGTLAVHNTVNPNIKLYMNSYTDYEIAKVQKYLHSVGIGSKIHKYKDGVKMLLLDWVSTQVFCKWIQPYVPKCMSYKTLGLYNSNFGDCERVLIEEEVTVSKQYKKDIVYCITTETGEFCLGDGTIVHNCNGIRGWLMHHQGKYYLFSRNYSDTDCSLLEYWRNISQYPTFEKNDTFVIDVEIMYEPDSKVKDQFEEMGLTVESKLEACTALLATYPETAHKMQDNYKAVTGKDLINFRLITPIYYKGVNYIKRTLGDMMSIYNEVVEYARARGLNVRPIKHLNGSREQKQAFLDSLLEAGSEGIVAYNLKESYKTSENRDKNTFIKLKRSVSGAASTAGIGDTIDGWISGFKMSTEKGANVGLIGSWEISVYVQDNGKLREHVIAYVPNIPFEIKKKCTVLDSEGNPTLREDFYNLIVELDGQCISAKSMRLTHPRMIRYRGDKIKEECIYSREFLESQIDHYFTE
nr:MAG TPA: LAGLIDADG DNA endonuclease family [Caudoviricetes sp.]